MADFHQGGCVSTLHRLDTRNTGAIERELEAFARRRPIALVLPCLFAEFSRPAIHHIIEELRDVGYLDTVVVSLGKAGLDDLVEAKRVFAQLPQRVSFVWNDGPDIQSIYALLKERGLDVGSDGKGRSCWIGYGQVLAEGRCAVVASHDCDITTYDRELLARLCYPVVHPDLGFDFAKGYYARFNGTLNGRVTRLFVAPLLRSLEIVLGHTPFLEYLASFRYPLSGEFAMKTEVARLNRIPCNWGLEVGVLAEVYRNCGLPRICQTELCPAYDHKHQVLSAGDPTSGLMKMAVDIAQMLFRSLSAEGAVVDSGLLNTLLPRYVRTAEDRISCYEADAFINCLSFDRNREEETVAAFADALRIAAARHADNPLGVSLMPSWARVTSAIPGILDMLMKAVEQDGREIAAA